MLAPSDMPMLGEMVAYRVWKRVDGVSNVLDGLTGFDLAGKVGGTRTQAPFGESLGSFLLMGAP